MALNPAPSVEQLKLLVRHHLLADSAVAALVGANVHGAHIQTPDSRTVVYPLVVLDVVAGRISPTSTYQLVTMDLYCYSRDSGGEALRIYDACAAALQHQLMRRDGIPVAGYCVESERPDQGWNEVARAYYARGQWAVRMSYRSGQ
jgi:hypothetical protein